jgi:hypothetical protein
LRTTPGIQGKPIAEIPSFLVRGRLGPGLRAVPPGAGEVKPAIPAGAEVLAAFGTPEGSSQGLLIAYRPAAIPAHGSIIPPPGRSCKGSLLIRQGLEEFLTAKVKKSKKVKKEEKERGREDRGEIYRAAKKAGDTGKSFGVFKRGIFIGSGTEGGNNEQGNLPVRKALDGFG